MAKLKAPLFSFSASGKLADALVFFTWKGLNVARQYVIPANPKSDAQKLIRKYLREGVAAIHAAQILAVTPLSSADQSAYSLLGSLMATPRTWFNTAIKEWINQYVAGLEGVIYHGCEAIGHDKQVRVYAYLTDAGANAVTEMFVWYGTKKTTLLNSFEMVDGGGGAWSAFVPDLINGTIYYFQMRPTVHTDYVGADSGIYHGTPVAP